MKERLKTLFLLILIMTSIFLANEIWIEVPNSFYPLFSEDSEVEDSKHLLSDIVTPEKVLVNFGTGHTIFFSDDFYLWDKGKSILANVMQEDRLVSEEISDEEYYNYKKTISVEYYFADEIHLNIFTKLLGINLSNDLNEKVNYISKIHIDLGAEPFIVLSSKDKHIKLQLDSDIDVSDIRKTVNNLDKNMYTSYVSIKNDLQFDNDEYISINMKHILPNVEVKKEKQIDVRSTDIESVVEAFFSKDPNYIQRYEEANGSKLYIYNQQVLKIHSNGMLEYFNQIDRSVTNRDLYTSLNTAVNFIHNHVGWPENSFIKSIEPYEWRGNKGYRFKFSYKILGGQVTIDEEKYSLKAPIEIEVFNDQIKSYRRFVKTEPKDKEDTRVIPDSEMLSVMEILEDKENSLIIREKYIDYMGLDPNEIEEEDLKKQILQSITDIYVAYTEASNNAVWIFGKEMVKPVWVIEIEDLRIMFDVYNENDV